jgi:hypothetical protein
VGRDAPASADGRRNHWQTHQRTSETARIIALTHHEKWDGSGYPQQLKGEAIPLEGRIVAIADVFDALVSVRPYKRAIPIDEALNYMTDQAGKHFDPTLIEAFKRALPEILRIKDIYADENGSLTDLEFHIQEIYDHKDAPGGYPPCCPIPTATWIRTFQISPFFRLTAASGQPALKQLLRHF